MASAGKGFSRIAAAPAEGLLLAGWGARSVAWPDARRWLRRCLAIEVEQRRLFPWLAVAFGAGVLLFFAAEGRPALWAPLFGVALCAVCAFALRGHSVGLGTALAVAALFAGFAAGVLRQRSVDAPVLQRLAIGPIAGFVETVDEREAGARLVVRLHEAAGLAADKRPDRVRVTLRDAALPKPGDFIAATARLLPPPEPARPGGYDFGRDAYFRGIGAVGSISGKIEVKPPPIPPGWRLRLAAAVDEARNALTRRIATVIGGQAGAVAAALVTGKRGLIDEDTNDALRAAGIYHIVSISGLHMVLAAGTFFWLARALLALSPAAALLWPLKKIAAVVAMFGASAYCIFSGSEVATERSLVMILVMLGAILVDRPALSMRNLALAALIVLAREPEALLGPSFQMSYGAVAGLTAAAEWARRRWPARERPLLPRAAVWLLRWSAALLGSTLIASLATAPFGTYHFHTVNPFGLLGNALALPLVSLAVMPLGLTAVLALPFGLDGWLWQLMGYAVAGVLRASEWVSGLSGSTMLVPGFGAGALGLMALALILFTVFVSSLRFTALIPAALGLALAATAGRDDLVIDRAGTGAAIRGQDGRLVVVGRPSSFVIEQWLKADGDSRAADDPSLRAAARCDALGCTAETAGHGVVAFVADRRAFAEDCARAATLLTRLPVPPSCKAALVVDARFLAAHGATAIRWTASGPKVITTRTPRSDRPWMRAPPQGEGTRAAPAPSRTPPRRRPAPNEDEAAEVVE